MFSIGMNGLAFIMTRVNVEDEVKDAPKDK